MLRWREVGLGFEGNVGDVGIRLDFRRQTLGAWPSERDIRSTVSLSAVNALAAPVHVEC